MRKVIVIGVPRSGTTLLASMLGGHPDISMMDECHTREWTKQIGTKYVGNKIACDGMVFSYKDTRFPIIGAIVNRIVNIFFKKQLIRLSPLYSFRGEDLVRMEAKFIVIARDKDDVINSNVRRSGMPMWVAKLKYRWGRKIIRNVICGYDTDLHPSVLFVDYEDLVKSPKVEAWRVCDFLGLPLAIDEMIKGSEFNVRYNRKL